MVKIEAYIFPHRLDEVKLAMERVGIQGMLISDVFDHSRNGPTTFYRGAEYRLDISRTKVEILVSSLQVDEVVEALSEAARTPGAADDGRILLFEVAEAIQIKTGTRVQTAQY